MPSDAPTTAAPRGPRPSNRIRDAITAQIPVHVLAIQAMSPDLIDLVGPGPAHGIWLETEHGPTTWDQLANLTRAAELW